MKHTGHSCHCIVQMKCAQGTQENKQTQKKEPSREKMRSRRKLAKIGLKVKGAHDSRRCAVAKVCHGQWKCQRKVCLPCILLLLLLLLLLSPQAE